MDLLLPPSKHVLRRDVARRAVQPNVVVVVHVSAYQTPCIIERQWRSWPDALPFERFVPALDLPVRLRVKRRRDEPAVAVQDTAQVVERPADVQSGKTIATIS